jgi:hypothetical protein
VAAAVVATGTALVVTAVATRPLAAAATPGLRAVACRGGRGRGRGPLAAAAAAAL